METKLIALDSAVHGARQQWVRTAIAQAAPNACQGHYLERLIAITEAFGLTAHAELLGANWRFLRDNRKPAGVDALTLAVSELVIAIVQHAGLDPVELKPLAWGLDLEALEAEGLEHLRLRA